MNLGGRIEGRVVGEPMIFHGSGVRGSPELREPSGAVSRGPGKQGWGLA